MLGHLLPQAEAWLIPPGSSQLHLVDAVGQIGVLPLVGVTGAQVDIGMLRRHSGTAARIGLGGLIVPLSAGIAIGYAVPAAFVPHLTSRTVFAALLGVAMAASAIPVIAKVLADLKLTHRNVGQLILSACALDDTAAWFLLSLVSAMATVGLRAGRIALSLAMLTGFVLAAVLVLGPMGRAVMRHTAGRGDAGPAVAAAAVFILLCAVITQALGFEAIFGAFVGGVLLSSPGGASPARLEPLRTVVLAVLVPVFLATAGLRVDLGVLARPDVLLWALILLTVATMSKFGGAYVSARISRLPHWESLAIGAGINARGVVEVVIAAVSLRLGVIGTTTYTIIILIAIATSVMAPPLLRLTMARVEIKDGGGRAPGRPEGLAGPGPGGIPAMRERSPARCHG